MFLALALFSACGTDSAGGDEPLDPPPPEGGQQLATDTYRLAPGEEKYMCYTFRSPQTETVGITRIETISMPGVHHIGLYTVAGVEEPVEPSECNVLQKITWMPLWGIGASAEHLDLPQGAGFVVPQDTQYVIQLHLQNTTEEYMDLRAAINLTYTRDVANLQQAGMFALGSFETLIPPNVTDYPVKIADCQTGRDMNVFAVFPHMHKRGKKVEVTHTPVGGTTSMFYKLDPWVFGEQPVDKMTFNVKPDDTFELTCTFDNPTGQEIRHGESTNDEMCFFVLFYYPFDELDGCVIGA